MELTEQAEQPPILPSNDECAALMQTVLRELRNREDTTQWAVDTLAFEDGTTVRHHYAGGECSLTLMRPGRDVHIVKWGIRHELPTARQILDRVFAYAAG